MNYGNAGLSQKCSHLEAGSGEMLRLQDVPDRVPP